MNDFIRHECSKNKTYSFSGIFWKWWNTVCFGNVKVSCCNGIRVVLDLSPCVNIRFYQTKLTWPITGCIVSSTLVYEGNKGCVFFLISQDDHYWTTFLSCEITSTWQRRYHQFCILSGVQKPLCYLICILYSTRNTMPSNLHVSFIYFFGTSFTKRQDV